MCIARSWKGLLSLLSHKGIFLKYSVNVGKKEQLVLGSIFEASVICRSEPDSCRKADNFDVSLGLQQRELNGLLFQK